MTSRRVHGANGSQRIQGQSVRGPSLEAAVGFAFCTLPTKVEKDGFNLPLICHDLARFLRFLSFGGIATLEIANN